MISRPLSIYLDVWRVLAALVVFIYHSGNTKGFGDAHLPRSMGFDDGRAAHLAVVVFCAVWLFDFLQRFEARAYDEEVFCGSNRPDVFCRPSSLGADGCGDGLYFEI